MGRETRRTPGRTYFYRKTRHPDGRIESTYFGNRLAAHLIEAMDAATRTYEEYRTAALEQFEADVDAADKAVRTLTSTAGEQLARVLEADGYRYHRGEWRRPRNRPARSGR